MFCFSSQNIPASPPPLDRVHNWKEPSFETSGLYNPLTQRNLPEDFKLVVLFETLYPSMTWIFQSSGTVRSVDWYTSTKVTESLLSTTLDMSKKFPARFLKFIAFQIAAHIFRMILYHCAMYSHVSNPRTYKPPSPRRLVDVLLFHWILTTVQLLISYLRHSFPGILSRNIRHFHQNLCKAL
jgi:hypothetical protein